MSTRPSGFEDRLKAALLARLPEVPPAAPARSFARRYGVPLAVGVATASVVTVMALPGSTRNGPLPAGSPSAAPEIKKDPDGSLRFGLPKNDQIPALVDRLKALGVQVALVPKRPPSQCSEPGGGGRGPQADPEAEVLQRGDDDFVLKVNAKTVPPGHTLMFTWADYHPLGARGVGIGVVETSKVPSCAVDYSEGLDEALKARSEPPKDPGKTIEVAVPTPAELPALVQRLQAQGVRVALVEKKPASECTHMGGGYRGTQADPEAELGFGRDTLKINSRTVPPGYTLVFTKPANPSSPHASVGYGVKETSKVTPCEIDFSPSDEERARMNAELQDKLKEQQGVPVAPPAGTSSR
ncbi:hypothetical protein [Streptomyces sp. NBC_01294]|uniref:hypothetical protein n=1 Tax=Streptomyces sp. NBC_01294 TaxID=2903815 RepID=UPI002DD7B41A|nr:hypothetical protein [Streptomyces sp. NBC_01294]WRZ60489.1 hypothetical protein OG534_30770 [Streptomyces sp. NBC_01294]